MPNASYVWLLGNPAFGDIPKGYVIHHLDGDELNDDISNLVLMQKFHHVAYHWKEKKINPTIKIKAEFMKIERSLFFPIHEPRIYQKPNGNYYVQFSEKFGTDRKKKNICSWDGHILKTKEMAEKVKNFIWKEEENLPQEPAR